MTSKENAMYEELNHRHHGIMFDDESTGKKLVKKSVTDSEIMEFANEVNEFLELKPMRQMFSIQAGIWLEAIEEYTQLKVLHFKI